MSTPGNPSWQPPPGPPNPPPPPSYPVPPIPPPAAMPPAPPFASLPPTAPYPQPPAYPSPPTGYPGSPTYAPPGSVRPIIPGSVQAVPIPVAPTVAPAPVPATPTVNTPASTKPVSAPRPIPIKARPETAETSSPSGNNRPVPLRPIPVKGNPAAIVTAKEDDDEADAPAIVVTPLTASPWLISTIVHFVLVIVLAFIFFPVKLKKSIDIEVVYAEAIGEQLQSDILDTGFNDPETTDAALSINVNAVDDPLAAPPQLTDPTLNAVGITSDIQAPSIGLALAGRKEGAKKALLSGYGGTATTEASVKLGLDWLKRNQRADGTWSLQGPYSNGATTENVTSATAMALLAFQGAGHTPNEAGEYQKTVDKGWKALLAMQDRDGNFVRDAGFNQQLYAQAQATIAICELYGMTKDSRYAAAADLAIQYAVKAQAPEGGWRYQPGVDADTSVTGWFVMALQSARMAGMNVPQSSLDGVTRWLDNVAAADGFRYRYQPNRDADVVMTAEAMLCRQYLGWKRDDERMQKAADYVLNRPVAYGPGEQDVYYWYYATQFLHHMEGQHWNKWNAVMRQAVPTKQITSGKEIGSWAPRDDAWGPQAGRLYVTCLSIYMLEVYYRHLPLYSNTVIH